MTMATARDIRVPDGGSESVRRIHALFEETLGNDAVEDLDSFSSDGRLPVHQSRARAEAC